MRNMLVNPAEFNEIISRGLPIDNYDVVDLPVINLNWSLGQNIRLGSGQTLFHAIKDKNKFVAMTIIFKHTGADHKLITQYVEDHWEMWTENISKFEKDIK